MKKATKILLIAALVLFAAGATFYIAYTELTTAYDAQLASMDAVSQKTAEIAAYLDEFFIDEYDEDALADAAAAAMVEATGDEWSYYLSAEEYVDYLETFNNAYVGIGVTITLEENAGVRVQSVTPGGSAEDAGIEVGDLITEVDGQATAPIGVEGTRALVRGEEGTELTLTIERGEKTIALTLTRRSIQTPVATCELLDGGIGYVHIYNFDVRCADETIACIEQMRSAGAKALLFDVRYNGGGLKDEMVEVLDYLLPEGPLFRSIDYEGVEEVDNSDASCLEMPMAVLVNYDSYSAAELFAAALQEYEWATIVGSKTYGKGNFQSGFELSDGSFLNISLGKYFTPKGNCLIGVGVTPDIECDLSDEDEYALYYERLSMEDDEQLQAALEALRKEMK